MAMTKRDLGTLKGVRNIATMEKAGFGMPHEFVLHCDSRGKVFGEPVHVTDFIREQTRLWRETWIIEPLDELIHNNG